MSCPSFVGPTVKDRTQIEFYCDVITNVTDTRARFNVAFVFNDESEPDVPVHVLDVTNLRATLHERYLAGRLEKAVRKWIFAISVLRTSRDLTQSNKTDILILNLDYWSTLFDKGW